MALADTARLIASLELQDKFSGPAKRAEGSISGLDRKMSTLSASGQRLGAGLSRAFSTIAKIGVGVAAGGIAALVVNVKAGVESLNELENVVTQSETVIKSTGGVAGQTAEDVRKLAEEFESLNATIDDKVIQNAENMLLTFTNVREDAFEPALEAVLNINQAMGGGEGGLQQQAIRVGKALNDPTKGLAALTKVGVTFSAEQKERITRLQEEGDLYGAQTIILKELETEFGGQFAAAGKTAEGSMARLGDAVEDLQQRLAGPLLPAIDRVRDKLADFLESKTAQAAAGRLGDAIAGIFTNENIKRGIGVLEDATERVTAFLEGGGGKDGGGLTKIAGSIGTIAESVGGLPWESIGNAARLLGTGSKALLDAFLGLPPWVQTAVLTGWGLNKLTGGALTGIVGELAKGLVKGVLGINAGVVNINAGTVNGAPTGGGGGRGIAGGLAIAAGVGLSAVAVERLIDVQQDSVEIGQGIRDAIDHADKTTLAGVQERLDIINDTTEAVNDNIITQFFGLDDTTRKGFADEKARLERIREGVRYADEQNRRVTESQTQRQVEQLRAGFGDNGAKIARVQGSVDVARGSIERGNAALDVIKNKPTSFTTNVTVNNDLDVGISATGIAATLTRIALTTNQQQHTVPTVQ